MPQEASKRRFPWFFNRTEEKSELLDTAARLKVVESALRDIKTSQGGGNSGRTQTAVQNKPRPAIAVLSYNRRKGNSRAKPFSDEGAHYHLPPYNLAEIAVARDSESMLQTSIERHVETALRPYKFESTDPEKIEYLKRRFWEMEVLSERSMLLFFEQVLDQLAAYGTAIIIAKRDAKRSTGHQIKWFKKVLDPIATLWVADAPTMCVAENNNGVIVSWKQKLQLNSTNISERTFPASDVFVISRHLQSGMVFGRPPSISVLDDIMSLRRLEDLADIIPQKHLFPLFQVMVGTDEHPAKEAELSDGSSLSEVEQARVLIQEMPTEGGFVTSHRWKFELIGSKDKVLDIMPYIDHFKERVKSGLRLNDTVMGSSRDSTKSTATHQMEILNKSAQYLQVLVEEGFKPILRQILQEGGFDETFEDEVKLNFSDPNDENKRAEEQHQLTMYQNELLTHEEARKRMGHKPMDEDEKGNTFMAKQHERAIELAEKGIEGKEKVAHIGAKARAAKNSASNRTRPANQHGKKRTKTRVKANDSGIEEGEYNE
jgi:hypothetical protein